MLISLAVAVADALALVAPPVNLGLFGLVIRAMIRPVLVLVAQSLAVDIHRPAMYLAPASHRLDHTRRVSRSAAIAGMGRSVDSGLPRPNNRPECRYIGIAHQYLATNSGAAVGASAMPKRLDGLGGQIRPAKTPGIDPVHLRYYRRPVETDVDRMLAVPARPTDDVVHA